MSSAMDKTLFNMRFTSKQLLRESKKAEKKSKDEVRCQTACLKREKERSSCICCRTVLCFLYFEALYAERRRSPYI